MRSRISIRGSVRLSVRPTVGLVHWNAHTRVGKICRLRGMWLLLVAKESVTFFGVSPLSSSNKLDHSRGKNARGHRPIGPGPQRFFPSLCSAFSLVLFPSSGTSRMWEEKKNYNWKNVWPKFYQIRSWRTTVLWLSCVRKWYHETIMWTKADDVNWVFTLCAGCNSA